MDDYEYNMADNNNFSADSGAKNNADSNVNSSTNTGLNCGNSENNGIQDKDSGNILDRQIDKVIFEINNMADVTLAGFKDLFKNTLEQLTDQIEQTRNKFESGVEETLKNYKKQQENDWRKQIVHTFSSWLHELTGEVFNAMSGEIDQDYDEPPPDFLSFFSELGSLKQEVRLQTKAAQTLSEKTDTILTTVKQEFDEQGQKLEHTTAGLKSQLAQARREGEDSILMEFIKVRDALKESIETWKKRKPLKKSWFKKNPSLLPEITKSLTTLLNKIDDSFNRLNIVTLCEEGMDFDAGFMRALFVSENTNNKPGTITKVIRQGYKKDGRILQIAEVQVQK